MSSAGRTRRNGWRSSGLAAVAVVGLLGLGVGALVGNRPRDAAAVSPSNGALPAGWSASPDGRSLTWRSPGEIPMLDARIDVQVDDAVLTGTVVSQDRHSLTVPLRGYHVHDPQTLAVVAAGLRLDRVPVPEPVDPGVARPVVPDAPDPRTPLPAADDPGKPGDYKYEKGEYHLDDLTVTGMPAPVEMLAEVVRPVGAKGPLPVAVFLHGRHMTCYQQRPLSAWPCPPGWQAVPSYLGYLAPQELLASQGWLTISISANGINAQDELMLDGGAKQRSELVRAHLSKLASWAGSDATWSKAPGGLGAGPKPDLSRVLLVGHSRGGEGVNRAAVDSATGASVPWTIRAQVLIGPMAVQQNPAPGVPTEVLLPACDGDVHNLQGQSYLDAARDRNDDPVLRSAVYIEGANHNYFNEQWTPGPAPKASGARDDWWGAEDPDPDNPDAPPITSDPVCGTGKPTRLSPEAQRTVGAVYIAAAAQALVDKRAAVLPLIDGSAVSAPSAGDVRVYTHALGGLRQELLKPATDTDVSGEGGVTAARCATTAKPAGEGACDTSAPGPRLHRTPSFLPYTGIAGEPTRTALNLRWQAAGGQAGAALTGKSVDAAATAIALRVIVPPDARGTAFTVALRDADQKRVELGSATLNGLPGGNGSRSGTWWAQEVRVPLDRAAIAGAKVDLSRLDRLEIVPRSDSGEVWLLDAWSWRSGLSTAAPARLPRFDVGTATATKQAADQTVNVPFTITGKITGEATVWVGVAKQVDGDETPEPPTIIPVKVDESTRSIPVKVPGEKPSGWATVYEIRVVAVKGIVGGDSFFNLEVTEPEAPEGVTTTTDPDGATNGPGEVTTTTDPKGSTPADDGDNAGSPEPPEPTTTTSTTTTTTTTDTPE